jgi:tocopherol cyclase
LSLDHEITGTIYINGDSKDFTGGRGYIEKDWGRSFPRYHIWLQTNHFDTPGTSLMLSIANIPWFNSYFDGFIAGLLYNDRLYRFATYTGARITKLDYDDKQLNIQISSKKHRLKIVTALTGGMELRSPVLGNMSGRLSESLQSEVSVSLHEIHDNDKRPIFQGTGRHAGFEMAGRPEDIASIKLS